MRVYTQPHGIATANIPVEMKSYRAWIVWQYEQRDGKPTKIPYRATDPERRASAIDLRTWAAFTEAVEAYETGGFDGIGFVLSSGDPFSAVDLDRCRDAETGAIEPWAQKIIAAARGYAEVSPSGTGIHVIVKGRAPNSKRGRVEAYSERRFITVTGRVL